MSSLNTPEQQQRSAAPHLRSSFVPPTCLNQPHCQQKGWLRKSATHLLATLLSLACHLPGRLQTTQRIAPGPSLSPVPSVLPFRSLLPLTYLKKQTHMRAHSALAQTCLLASACWGNWTTVFSRCAFRICVLMCRCCQDLSLALPPTPLLFPSFPLVWDRVLMQLGAPASTPQCCVCSCLSGLCYLY